ncbi:hypothetical protein GCM10011503_06170 [Henriciella pelagia]|uniref:Uncharacterized protein n=1 Tax=Henriciella pelagia TaxID=1977912 RepID=A0ABQ1J7P2_9PROT|nr:hypothetical protein GCM10011503_06170 [Henriciella pelagia]
MRSEFADKPDRSTIRKSENAGKTRIMAPRWIKRPFQSAAAQSIQQDAYRIEGPAPAEIIK